MNGEIKCKCGWSTIWGTSDYILFTAQIFTAMNALVNHQIEVHPEDISKDPKTGVLVKENG